MKAIAEDTPEWNRPFGESFFSKMKYSHPALAPIQIKTKAGFHFARGSALQPAPHGIDIRVRLAVV